MQTEFYATIEDKKLILDFIFNETNYQVYDHYSSVGQELKQYFSTEQILKNFDLNNGGQYATCFGLWNPLDGTKNIIRKINLNPEVCDGYTFRFSSDGWGVQRLYLGGIQNEYLNPSMFIGFNEKGAIYKDLSLPENERSAQTLDWTLIRSDQRKLKNYIEKKIAATTKIGKIIILMNAQQQIENQSLKTK